MTIDVFTVRGTGERFNGPQLLDDVTRRLDPNRFHCIETFYPASVGPTNPELNPFGPSLNRSLTVGKYNLADAIRRTQNRAGVIGYSLGAYVISELLEDIERGAPYTQGCEITFAATVANPRRLPDVKAPVDMRMLRSYGIAGGHAPWPGGIRYIEIANPDDCICCCPVGSPLRTLSDQLSAFSFAEAGGWSADLADRLRRGRWQPTSVDWLRDPIGTWRAYSEAARLMAGYLGTEHNVAYVRDGHLARLADVLNKEVW